MSALLVRCLRCFEEHRVLLHPSKTTLPRCPDCGGELVPLTLMELIEVLVDKTELVEV